ncbi:MAG: energy transducer TonB, partial [Holophagales bacterium]|nr:energy transducer TonB [Holophagales bacterium]
CADAVIRLRAEYLFARRCDGEIAFDFTSGDRARWSAWAAGNRPRVEGDRVSWSRRASPDASYASFRRYLSAVFTYAGTYSLARELERVEDPARALPGDVFVQGGFPGHAVVVLDVAESLSGSRRLLLAQSYMPAQDLHVLVGPGGSVDPWYPALAEGTLETPEWRFDYRDLRRFPSATCSGEHPEESSDAGGELLEVGGDVLPPRPAPGNRLSFLAPGCNRPLHGVLVARLVVEKSGEASSIELLKVPGDGCLAEALRQQLDGWRFTPATRDGEPVRVHYHLSTTIHPR